MSRKIDPFISLSFFSGAVVLAFLLLPLTEMMFAPSLATMGEAAADGTVRRAIGLSLSTSCGAGIVAFIIGTPFAYLLARKNFPGKKLVESVIDLPIMIPHPVIGIAILSVAGRNHWLGQMLLDAGIRIMGSVTGLVTVLTFVGMPFYVNAVKSGFEAVPERLENVSRTLGSSSGGAFMRVTFPLAWRSMLVGFIMCVARALSEFGAVVIVAYHPMIAPVLIYERFTAYGLKYSQPVAVWLILISLVLFLLLRLAGRPAEPRS